MGKNNRRGDQYDRKGVPKMHRIYTIKYPCGSSISIRDHRQKNFIFFIGIWLLKGKVMNDVADKYEAFWTKICLD